MLIFTLNMISCCIKHKPDIKIEKNNNYSIQLHFLIHLTKKIVIFHNSCLVSFVNSYYFIKPKLLQSIFFFQANKY